MLASWIVGAALLTSPFTHQADLEVALSAPPAVYFGEEVLWSFTVTNLGPDDAYDIEIDSVLVEGPPCVRQFLLPVLKARERYQRSCSQKMPLYTPRSEQTIAAGAKSRLTPDPNIENNYRLAQARIATTDLSVTLDAPLTARAGTAVTWSAIVTNRGPDAAHRVALTTNVAGAECQTEIANLPAGESFTLSCTKTPPTPGYSPVISAWAMTRASRDPVLDNNSNHQTLRLQSNPDLFLYYVVDRIIDPDLPFTLTVRYANWAHTTATNVRATIDVFDANGFESVPDFCIETSPTRVECSLGDLPSSAAAFDLLTRSFELEPIANSDASGAPLEVVATITANEDDERSDDNRYEYGFQRFRTFYVTNGSDSGQGSLRAAIETANLCSNENCKIAFRIEPESGRRWHTIRPATPLPAIVGHFVTVDASIQSRFFADQNVEGPEIELRGDLLVAGDGLELAGRAPVAVHGLAINGFPGNGITIAGVGEETTPYYAAVPIRDCYIGTDPTGMQKLPNHRGIFANRNARYSGYAIEENLISGNRRAGIFSGRGIRVIQNNRIGISRDLSAPLPNGASGIYIGPASKGTDVIDNTIAFNEHFGIAIDAQLVAISGNSIHGNHQGGIDVGLDGPSAKISPFPYAEYSLEIPIITNARYDPVENLTVIEGTTDRVFFQTGVTLYANDAPDPSGFGEGQYVLGKTIASHRADFTFRYAGDLRGKWITATSTRTIWTGFAKPATELDWMMSATSEFSRAVPVAP